MTALLLMGEVTIWDFVIILAVVVALFVGAEYLNRHDTHPTGTTFMVDKGGRYEFHVVATYPTTAPASAAAPPAAPPAAASDPARLARLDSRRHVRRCGGGRRSCRDLLAGAAGAAGPEGVEFGGAFSHDHNPLNADITGGICSACEWETNEGRPM